MKKIIILGMISLLMTSCIQEKSSENDKNIKNISQSESIKIPKKLGQAKLDETEEIIREKLDIPDYVLNHSMLFHNDKVLLKKLLKENEKLDYSIDIYTKTVFQKYMDSLFLVDGKYYVSEFVNQPVSGDLQVEGYTKIFSIDAKTGEEQEMTIASEDNKYCTGKKTCKNPYYILFISKENNTILLTSSFGDVESTNGYFEIVNIKNGMVEKIYPKKDILFGDVNKLIFNSYFYDKGKIIYFDRDTIGYVDNCDLKTITCSVVAEAKLDANLPDSEREQIFKLGTLSQQEFYQELKQILSTYNKEKNSIIIPIYNDEYIEKEKREIYLDI